MSLTFIKIIVGVIFMTSFNIQTHAQNISHMNDLARRLLDGYDKNTLPINDMDSSVFEVKVKVILITLGDLDEVEEKLSTVMGFTLAWTDPSITWWPWTENDIENITLDAKVMWKPVFKVKNRHHSVVRPADPESDNKIYYSNDGGAVWTRYTAFDTTCNINTVFYPFDKQICEVQLAISDYIAYRIRVIPVNVPEHLEVYQDNGAWSLLQYEVNGGEMSNLTLSYTLRRKPLFVLVNVLLPIVTLAFLTPLVFLLPMGSGERVGFSITTLLAISVYMMILSENLPKNSDAMPIISIVLLAWYIMTAVIVFLVIVNYTIYQITNETKIPEVLVKMVKLTRKCTCRKAADNVWRETRSRTHDRPADPADTDKAALNENAACFNHVGANEERVAPKDPENKVIGWPDVSDVLDRIFMVSIYSLELIFTLVIVVMFLSEISE